MAAMTQVIEKNHFPGTKYHIKHDVMSKQERRRTHVWMMFLAAGMALAILAPVAVLAA